MSGIAMVSQQSVAKDKNAGWAMEMCEHVGADEGMGLAARSSTVREEGQSGSQHENPEVLGRISVGTEWM
jgi:hypothetical protein